jgi:hypothetical protein
VPLGILAAVFGATFMIGNLFEDPDTKKAPRWLLVVPFALGLTLGSLDYFTVLDRAPLQANPWWLNCISALLMGAGYGGAEVLLWIKVAKKTFGDERHLTCMHRETERRYSRCFS